MSDSGSAEGWQADRTTFQRVYDVIVGSQTFEGARAYAERAECSETGARQALEQLVEMGIAERRDGRPARYRRNDSYVRWRRVESLAREHSPEALRDRVEALITEDEAFQDEYGVPDPGSVSTGDISVDDHEGLEERWADVSEWRTIRRDITVLRRAVDRAEARLDDAARA